ncbi:MAG: hypothetical protein FJ296_09240, partial [Planctomycetes bacterium]|nr:hypothetical protein [Planctomycetota bacterium]
MKKLFIGCGILVLLLLAGAGLLVWSFWGDIRQLQVQAEQSFVRLDEMRTRFPFDGEHIEHLDGERFARALELRATLEADFRAIEERIIELDRKSEAGEEGAGFFDVLRSTVAEISAVLPNLARRLDEAQMSWPELSWHSRVLWSVLHRIDVGAAEAELAPLKGTWDKYSALYEQLAREQRGMLPLRDMIGDFPPAVVAEASALVARDIGRVRAGLGLPELEHFFLTPVEHLEDLQFAKAPGREDRPAAAEPAA